MEVESKNFTVNHSNWPAFDLFSLCLTQWHTSPTGQRTGLDYQALFAIAKVIGVKTSRRLLDKIRCLEAGAMYAMNDQDISELLDG